MTDAEETAGVRHGAPVIPRPLRVLAHLEHMSSRLERQIAEFDALPEDHPNRERLRSSDAFNRENKPAIGWAIKALRYYCREVGREAHASTLLATLVDAVRATKAARTQEARAQAAALLDEAMEHAGPFSDDEAD